MQLTAVWHTKKFKTNVNREKPCVCELEGASLIKKYDDDPINYQKTPLVTRLTKRTEIWNSSSNFYWYSKHFQSIKNLQDSRWRICMAVRTLCLHNVMSSWFLFRSAHPVLISRNVEFLSNCLRCMWRNLAFGGWSLRKRLRFTF